MDHPSGSIEQIIQQTLAELGFAKTVDRGQAFLLHKRQLVGRRFCFDGVEVVWLSGKGRSRSMTSRASCCG